MKSILIGKFALGLFLYFLALAFPVTIFAQEGTVDTSFGGTGYVSTAFSPTPIDDGFWDAAVQSDGKIIAAGYTTDAATGNVDMALARYNSDGSLDTSFGNSGKATRNHGDYDFIWDGIAIQNDGKILLAAGNFSGPNQAAYLYRLNPDGTDDPSFGNNGVVTVSYVSYFDAVTVQADGKIVATGAKIIIPGQLSLLVVRLNTDGSFDSSFGTGGQVITDLGIPYASGEVIRVQEDNKIVIGVQYDTVIRLNADGTLDAAFGNGGMVTTGNVTRTPLGLELQPDGKIIIGGTDYSDAAVGNADFALARYNTDGTLDTSFAQNGIAKVDINGSWDEAIKIARQSNGQIVIAGYANTGSDFPNFRDIALARHNADGSIDTSFGTNGITTLDIGPTDQGWGLTLQPDGQIIVVGDHNNQGTVSNVIARFNGTPVTSNEAPTITSITASVNPVLVNSPTMMTAFFTDANIADTHTAVWDWGDGRTSNGTINGSNGSVSDSQIYTTAGVYQITVTLIDNNGGTETKAFQYLSVYNATSQGLFSAGQKYTSPAGAYLQNAGVTGEVKFGLSYKYQGTMPTGNRQFSMDFAAADFNFNAINISSLVISNGIGTLKGTGAINGSGTYNFLVTGNENANTIRIRVTDPANNNAIYDTQIGQPDTDLPTTPVTGHVLAH